MRLLTMLKIRSSFDATAADGAAAAEFAIWLSVLVPAMLNVVDIGIYAWDKMQVSNAAQSAVQAVWTYCPTTPVSTNCDTKISDAISGASGLKTSVQEDTTQRQEGYACPVSGTLQWNASGVTTCSSGKTAGYYFKTQVTYAYRPVFTGISVASLLSTPITQSAWTRIK
jgi:Flp pilus assembly protein TadG